MPRIALAIEYNGKDFHGSQYQVGVRTVQLEIESALATFFRKPVRLHLSGRTDAGVHAAGQVAHFDVHPGGSDEESRSDKSDREEAEEIDLFRLCASLNGIMGRDISVRAAQFVSGQFHARYKAVARQYVYRILNRQHRSALLKDTHFFVPSPLDLDAMKRATGALIGVHDFTAFRSTNADKTSTVCHVQRAELLNLGEGRLEFWIGADHFVYNMVRIIVGTLIDIGLGKRAPESLAQALASAERDLAGPTAPPWGLTLNSVEYPPEFNLFQSGLFAPNSFETGSLVSQPGESQ